MADVDAGRGGPPTRAAAARRWLWALGIVALGVIAFLAVRGPFRMVSAVGVVIALLALIRPPAAGR